jgi:micrococcal nuclease
MVVLNGACDEEKGLQDDRNGAVGGSTPPHTTSGPSPGVADATPSPIAPVEQPQFAIQGEHVSVVEVVDGDTIKVSIDGALYTVRYIGVDTPETKHPTVGVECFGREASAANQQLVGGKTVLLEKDISETDRYGRLLRYVWLDGELVNERLVREGYAVSSTYPPDVKYQERFLAAQKEAREANRGLWGACGGADVPEGVPPVVPLLPAGDCDPSYPDVCIPSPPPDLDCGEIAERRFRVLPPDPHRFDGDHDGIGCES